MGATWAKGLKSGAQWEIRQLERRRFARYGKIPAIVNAGDQKGFTTAMITITIIRSVGTSFIIR